MKKLKIRRVIAWTCFALLLFQPMVHAEILKTLSAKVQSAEIEKNILQVTFQNPVTEQNETLVFTADQNTGFGGGVQSIAELKREEPVVIDYVETKPGVLTARRIARVQMEGPPEGLENFHGF